MSNTLLTKSLRVMHRVTYEKMVDASSRSLSGAQPNLSRQTGARSHKYQDIAEQRIRHPPTKNTFGGKKQSPAPQVIRAAASPEFLAFQN